MKIQEDLKAAKLEAQVILIDLDTSKSDVGDVAKAISAATTPHKDKVAPAAALVMQVKSATKGDTEKVRRALHGVKGVVAKESTAQKGEVIIPLDNHGGARLAEITKAVKKVAE